MSVVFVGPVVLCVSVASGVMFSWSKGSAVSSSLGILYGSTMIGLTVTLL